jgi:hypothetical protein
MTATALLSLAGLAPLAALAQTAPGSSPFDMLDTDHNGVLSAQEAQAHPVVSQNFTVADKNGDGTLTREEFNSAFTTKQQGAPPASPSPQQSPSPESPPR